MTEGKRQLAWKTKRTVELCRGCLFKALFCADSSRATWQRLSMAEATQGTNFLWKCRGRCGCTSWEVG